jgi:hypothetical protein
VASDADDQYDPDEQHSSGSRPDGEGLVLAPHVVQAMRAAEEATAYFGGISESERDLLVRAHDSATKILATPGAQQSIVAFSKGLQTLRQAGILVAPPPSSEGLDVESVAPAPESAASSILSPPASPPTSDIGSNSKPKGSLAEVQSLWKQGLTDSQIGETLHLSTKTVQNYIGLLRKNHGGDDAAPRRRRGNYPKKSGSSR